MLDNTFSADYFLHNSFTVGNLLKKVNIMKKDRGEGLGEGITIPGCQSWETESECELSSSWMSDK